MKNDVVVGGSGNFDNESEEAKRERNNLIMQSFAKTIWKVLKQQYRKLQVVIKSCSYC